MRNYGRAIRHLKRADPVLRRVVAETGPCRLAKELNANQFGALVDAILYQQISYRAAQSISRRFQKLFAKQPGGRGRPPRPPELWAISPRKLRAAGLSRQKVKYLRDLARHAADGSLMLGRFGRMTDQEVLENVTQVKGIGAWTGHMFLMFCLGRPDVLPVGDFGFQCGFRDAYGMKSLPAKRTLEKTAEAWRPYRSVATWYLWALRRKRTAARRA